MATYRPLVPTVGWDFAVESQLIRCRPASVRGSCPLGAEVLAQRASSRPCRTAEPLACGYGRHHLLPGGTSHPRSDCHVHAARTLRAALRAVLAHRSSARLSFEMWPMVLVVGLFAVVWLILWIRDPDEMAAFFGPKGLELVLLACAFVALLLLVLLLSWISGERPQLPRSGP
jgi:hypothetical protein